MKTRITGVLSILIGIAAAVVGTWGFVMTESMAELPASEPFDAQQWSIHWKMSSIIIAGLGITLSVAGAALFRRKRWGFLLLFVVAAITAFFPWLLSIVGFSNYAFEQPVVLESVIFVGVGIAALVAYRRVEVGG